MGKIKSLSIFFPAFNEQENVPIVVGQAQVLAPKIADKYEIIVVNDGSSDSTEAVTRKLAQKDSHVKLVNHKVNSGYGAALRSGFYNSKYDWITYMDGDAQFNFSEVLKLLEKSDTADLVVGYRIKRADNFVRRVNGRLWNFLVTILLRLPVKDVDCGFKLIKKSVIDNIPKLESDGATISGELLVKARKKGFKIEQVGLLHQPRRFGNQTGGNPLHMFRAFSDLFTLIPKL